MSTSLWRTRTTPWSMCSWRIASASLRSTQSRSIVFENEATWLEQRTIVGMHVFWHRRCDRMPRCIELSSSELTTSWLCSLAWRRWKRLMQKHAASRTSFVHACCATSPRCWCYATAQTSPGFGAWSGCSHRRDWLRTRRSRNCSSSIASGSSRQRTFSRSSDKSASFPGRELRRQDFRRQRSSSNGLSSSSDSETSSSRSARVCLHGCRGRRSNRVTSTSSARRPALDQRTRRRSSREGCPRRRTEASASCAR